MAQKSDSTVTCDEVVNKCRAYVITLEDQTRIQRQAIEKRDERILELSKAQAAYPWYFYATIGLAVGVVVGIKVK